MSDISPTTARWRRRPEERTPETIAARFAEISDRDAAQPLDNAFGQTFKFTSLAARAKAR